MRHVLVGFLLLSVSVLLTVSCGLTGSEAEDEAAALVGPTWQLVSLHPPEGASVPVDSLRLRERPRDQYVVRFTPNGRVGGRAECNTFGGTYTVVDESRANDDGPATAERAFPRRASLSIDSLHTTLKGCGGETHEAQFMEALSATDRYAIDGRRLRLDDEDGGHLRFEAE
jgi:heat shock protein HslJ